MNNPIDCHIPGFHEAPKETQDALIEMVKLAAADMERGTFDNHCADCECGCCEMNTQECQCRVCRPWRNYQDMVKTLPPKKETTSNPDDWFYMTREQRLEVMLMRVMEDWKEGCKFDEVIIWDYAASLLQEKTEQLSVTELCCAHPNLAEYIKGIEDQLASISLRYSLMREKIVLDDARVLFGGRQAGANYTPMEKCIKETSHRLHFNCKKCNGSGYRPDDETCETCGGTGIIEIPELNPNSP